MCGLTKFGTKGNSFLEANFSKYAFISSSRENLALTLGCIDENNQLGNCQLYSVKVKEF